MPELQKATKLIIAKLDRLLHLMTPITALLTALIVSKVLLITVIYFLWRTNKNLKEANHIIFLMRRRGVINEKDLEELRKAAANPNNPEVR